MASIKIKRKSEEFEKALAKKNDAVAAEEPADLNMTAQSTEEAETLKTPQTEEVAPVPAETEDEASNEYMNDAEQSALAEQQEKKEEESNKVSFAKMEEAVEVVQNQFNLLGKGFAVTSFTDKGSKFQLSMTNGDFDITVLVKDTEKYGII